MKAVFVSNISYIRHYHILNGLTGTLGSEPEREFLKEVYNSSFLIIPTAFPKQFVVSAAKLLDTQEHWLSEVVAEVKLTFEKKRALVVFCQSIQDVKVVSTRIKNGLNLDDKVVHTYIRDSDIFIFESDPLQPGHVIVATNLAGRGTDIKISEDLHENGGLHVCLTYLPDNVRIEEQAFGRSGKQSNKSLQ